MQNYLTQQKQKQNKKDKIENIELDVLIEKLTLGGFEVEDILEVALQHFLDDKIVINSIVDTSYSKKVEVPAFKLNGHVVWGATAMMLSEIKDLLKQML